MRTNTRYRHPAFTIVELSTTISVMTILMAVVILGYGTWKQGLAARTVQQELRAAIAAANSEKNIQNIYPSTVPTSYRQGTTSTVTLAWGSKKQICLNAVATTYSTVKYYIGSSYPDPVSGVCPAAPASLTTDGNRLVGPVY